MQIVIDIHDKVYGLIKYFESALDNDYKTGDDVGAILIKAVLNGTSLPDGAEILTKEAYSDLCKRAADVPETNVGDLPSARLETHEKRTETHACDCISRKAAIKAIGNVPDYDDGMVYEALSHAQRDVALLPPVELERKSDSMTVDDYRDRMIEAFHNADCDELIALIVLPSEKEFEHLEWLLKNHYHHSVPERKTVKWLLKIEDWNKWTCSECGFSTRTDIHVTLGYKYCPKCGVPMEVDR